VFRPSGHQIGRYGSKDKAFAAADAWLGENVNPILLLTFGTKKNPDTKYVSPYPWEPHARGYILDLKQFNLQGFYQISPSYNGTWSVAHVVDYNVRTLWPDIGSYASSEVALRYADRFLESQANPVLLLAAIKKNPKQTLARAKENAKKKYVPCLKWEPIAAASLLGVSVLSPPSLTGFLYKGVKNNKTYVLQCERGQYDTVVRLFEETTTPRAYAPWAGSTRDLVLRQETKIPVRNVVQIENRAFAWADSYLCDPLELLARSFDKNVSGKRNPYADPYANTSSKYHGWLETPGGRRYQLNLDKFGLEGRIVVHEDSLGAWWVDLRGFSHPFRLHKAKEEAFAAVDVWLEKNVEPMRLLGMISKKNPEPRKNSDKIKLHEILSQYPWIEWTGVQTAYSLALDPYGLWGTLVISPSSRIASEDVAWWSVRRAFPAIAGDRNRPHMAIGQAPTLKQAFVLADGWLEKNVDPLVLLSTVKKNPRTYGLRGGQFQSIYLPEKRTERFDVTGETLDELAGNWQRRQGHPLQASPSAVSLLIGRNRDEGLVTWLQTRLGRTGFRLGVLLGSGVWGSVFSLLSLEGQPTGLVVKVTRDANEVATAHRVLQSGIQTPALPEILGAWGGAPYDLWFIVREDVAKTCEDRPSRKLCLVIRDLRDLDPTLFWASRPSSGQGVRDFHQLTLRDQVLVRQFLKELRRIKQITGVNFVDISPDNVRLREAPEKQLHLVVTDFGFSSGPAVTVPVVSNPKASSENDFLWVRTNLRNALAREGRTVLKVESVTEASPFFAATPEYKAVVIVRGPPSEEERPLRVYMQFSRDQWHRVSAWYLSPVEELAFAQENPKRRGGTGSPAEWKRGKRLTWTLTLERTLYTVHRWSSKEQPDVNWRAAKFERRGGTLRGSSTGSWHGVGALGHYKTLKEAKQAAEADAFGPLWALAHQTKDNPARGNPRPVDLPSLEVAEAYLRGGRGAVEVKQLLGPYRVSEIPMWREGQFPQVGWLFEVVPAGAGFSAVMALVLVGPNVKGEASLRFFHSMDEVLDAYKPISDLEQLSWAKENTRSWRKGRKNGSREFEQRS
jgi:hypothetical protein